MAGQQTGATASTTKKDAVKPTEAKMAAKRTVTYLISTAASKAGINLAYAVAVDGTAMEAYANKVDTVRTDGGAIKVTVESGKKVSLFLNSDSVPGRRNNRVYEVAVKDKNVQVTITEKKGKSKETDTPVLIGSDKTTEKYKAPLTGDIWMKITHKFTAADVDALVKDASAEVLAATKSIYAGLPGRTLTMAVPSKSFSTTLTFGGNQNAADNINNFSLTADGLPRVHPACYAAILTAAVDSNATAIEMSSNWRPLLGSIAHRCGLGCDVVNIDGTGMLNTAADNSRVNQLKQAYLKSKTEAAKKAWETARDKDQPVKVQSFRRSLQQNPGVKQVIDPWEIDLNTRDTSAATPNLGGNATATSHLNHLHVTARDEFLIK